MPSEVPDKILSKLSCRLHPLLGWRLASANPHVATSVTLSGVILAVLLAAALSGDRTSSKVSAGRVTKPLLAAVGSAQAFCKEQTWPNVDARCVNRIAPIPVSAPADNKSPVMHHDTKITSGVDVSPPAHSAPQSGHDQTLSGVPIPSDNRLATADLSRGGAAAQTRQDSETRLPAPPWLSQIVRCYRAGSG